MRCARKTAIGRDWHAADILPVTIHGRKGDVLVLTDEHPRATSLDRLAALPTPFRKGGTVTAGNAAGINDGASAVLLASPAAVKRYGLTPLARVGGRRRPACHRASWGSARSRLWSGWWRTAARRLRTPMSSS